MSILSFFKKKSQTPNPSVPENQNVTNMKTKEEVFKAVLEQMARRSPSQRFVQGAVFDIVRQNHSVFEQLVRAHDVMSLQSYLINAYFMICNGPAAAGAAGQNAPKADNHDTDPREWNVDIVDLRAGDVAALCFMPINDPTYEARMVGIVLGQGGDGYYYCNLNRDERLGSAVMRNKALFGVEEAGEVNGRGFELMNAFLRCMQENYYAN